MTSKEFKLIVGAIVSMSQTEQEALVTLLKCKSDRQWQAIEFLDHIVYNSTDLGAASAALGGIK